MTNLERRALLGDAEAQRECTEKGIVLGCPKCGAGSDKITYCVDSRFVCEECGISQNSSFYTYDGALADWNTRAAPPVGRCASCACWDENTCECVAAADIEVAYHRYTEPDFFCGDYEPKGGEEDG